MTDVLYALWLILPAYVANASAVIFKGNMLVDFGKKLLINIWTLL